MSDPREQVACNFRIPPELREQLKSAAVSNQRSLNAEIVFRLKEAFKTKRSLKAVAAGAPATEKGSLSAGASADRIEQHIKQTEIKLASIHEQIASVLEMLQAKSQN